MGILAEIAKRRKKKHKTAAEKRRERELARRRKRRRRKKKHPKPKPKPTTPVAKPDPPSPPAPPTSRNGLPLYTGTFGIRQAERLLWRAGTGPRRGEAAALAALGRDAAVFSLTRPSGAATFIGAAPKTSPTGDPIAPADAYGHDHLYVLDRLVRSSQPLVERMALIWHDWFATSNGDVNSQQRMLDQQATLRANALGSFDALLTAVTIDPAMLMFLNGNRNSKTRPNENYAREVMELFTLGADRGAYTETDVRELARCLTGWTSTYVQGQGETNFRYDAGRHDTSSKTVFGRAGNWTWQDALRLCLEHPLHASYFVGKLWSYFIPTPPDAATQAALERLYASSGRSIRAVVEAILCHPAFYWSGPHVKPPVIYVSGLLKILGRTIDDTGWVSLCTNAGQRLLYPPNVAGWDESRWLDTSTLLGRWQCADRALKPFLATGASYDPAETPQTAVTNALGALGDPNLTAETRAELLRFATESVPATTSVTNQRNWRAARQNALRMLIATSPDHQTS